MEEGNKKIATKKRSGWVLILKVLFGLFLALILFSFAVNLPIIQIWGVNRITSYLTNQLDTQVEVKSFHLNIFKHLELGDIYIQHPERKQDTLLYSGHLDIRFESLFSLLKGRLAIKEITLNNGLLRFERTEDHGKSTISYLLEKLSSKSKKKLGPTRTTFDLSLKRIFLNDMRVSYRDGLKSMHQFYAFKKASFDFKEIDFDKRVMHANSFSMEDSQVQMVKTNAPVSFYWDSVLNIVVIDTFNTVPWQLNIDHIDIKNIQLEFDNFSKSPVPRWPKEFIDLHHFSFDDIDIKMNNFSLKDLVFEAEVENIHLLHKNGFEILKLSAEQAYLDQYNLKLNGWVLETSDTYLKENITLVTTKFSDYETFEDLVKIQFNTPGSKIAIRDFVRIVPKLFESEFFRKNMDKTVFLEGNVNGPINRLNVQNMNFKVQGFEMAGDFKSSNLAYGGTENIMVEIDSSFFRVEDLVSMVPNFDIPPNFKKLGLISFKGNFNGSFEDFVSSGDFKTDLGSAKADLKLNLVDGLDQASYLGSLALQDFDLGTFTGNTELGKTTLSTRIVQGRGLSHETATVDLDGRIDYIQYRGYSYPDIALKGNLNQKLFDGSVSIHNDDIDLDFNGLIDQRDSIPNYIFKAEARNLNLYALNLLKTPLTISGFFDVDMRALNLDQLFGLASGHSIVLSDSLGIEYRLESFSIESKYDDIDYRNLVITSDFISGNMVGDFKIRQVVPVVKRHLKEYYPRYFSSMILPDSIYNYGDQRFNFRLSVGDSKNWFDLLGAPDLRIARLNATGYIDTREVAYGFKGILPEFHYKNFNIYDSRFEFDESAGQGYSTLHILAGDINEKMIFEDILLENKYANDSLLVHLNSSDLTKIVGQLDLTAEILPSDSNYAIHIRPIKAEIFNEEWTIDENNLILLGKESIKCANSNFTNGHVTFNVENFGSRGIEITGGGLEVRHLNEIWDYERLDFSGNYSTIFQIQNVFEFKDYSLNINSPQLSINNESYGVFNFEAKMSTLGEKTNIDISIIEGDREIIGKGYYYLPINEVPEIQQNDWNLEVQLEKLPMMFWQYIIGDNISNTEGYINADLVFDGKINKTDIHGNGRVYEGKTKVNYLGTTYSFHDQPITVTPSMIDMTGAILTDEAGNRATITGGITHQHIKNLGLDAVISSPEFIGLKTTPADNPTYYGYVVGRMYVTFSGLIERPSISLNGETAAGTYLALPIDYTTETSEDDFVTFTKFTRESVQPVAQQDVLITGVDFDMNVTINEGATMELIFDQQSGEILRGAGQGDIQFSLSRNGEMNMTGVYEIKQGNYLFTNFLIRKPFVIKEGGTIRWDGDPLQAILNIEAEYERLRASTAIFIEEYLSTGSASAKSDASVKTDVDLTLIITGILSSPNLDFRISFPNLNGEVKGYVDSKLRILQSDNNAMLEQVMGLLLTRSFLPSNTIVNSTGQVATSSLNNTVSELISSQLSSYLSGFFSNAADKIGFINSIEFDVGVDFNPFGQANISSAASLGDVLTESGNEVEVRTRYRLFDDRLTFDVGGNYTTESPLLAGGRYFAGDYALEYDLTNDKRFKIRFYHRNDLTIEGRKNKLNLGLTYRREFDDFAELFSSKKTE